MLALGRGFLMLGLTLTLAACQEDGPRASGETGGVPDPLAEQREACESTGGRWGARTGGVLFTCYRPTSDANQLCSASSDCESLCLARSRTCAPIEPFLGCHEILTNGGQRATQCIN